MNKVSVLILAADGTQSLPIAESLCKHGYDVHGFFGHKMSYGYASRYFRHKTIVTSDDEQAFLKTIIDYVKVHGIDVLFPMSDATAELISKNSEVLEKTVKFVAPPYDVFRKGYDKNQLMTACERYGIPHPRTIDLETTGKESIDDNIFPALIKPNITCGGRGMTLVRSMKDFEEKYENIRSQYGACHLQEFIEAGGRQVKAQLFVDREGKLLCSSVMHKQRFYPEKGGSSSCNTTIDDDDTISKCMTILKNIHWVGFADFDLIEDPKDGVLKIMEINPRVPACVKSAVKAGADYAELYVDYALGKKTKKYSVKSGYTLRHLGFETLWFMQSKDRFHTKPSWFKFWGSKIYYQDCSLKDPFTFVAGSMENIIKLANPAFRKSKSGTR